MNLTLVTSVALKIKVTTPKRIGFLGGQWGSCILGFKLIAVKLFELLRGNGVLRQIDGQHRNSMPILWWAYKNPKAINVG